MKAVLRFLAALPPAHLLQKWRDTNGLHPVFCRPGEQRAVLSPVFWSAHQTWSHDLRKFLTGLHLVRLGSGALKRPEHELPLSCGEVVIAGILLLCSSEHTLLKEERTP